jgi:hypothetical protein
MKIITWFFLAAVISGASFLMAGQPAYKVVGVGQKCQGATNQVCDRNLVCASQGAGKDRVCSKAK